MNVFITIIIGLPLYMFFIWRGVAAWQSCKDGITDPKNSPVIYLLSNGVVYTIISIILIFCFQEFSLFEIIFISSMFSLGIWHFYWLYKFKRFQKTEKIMKK